MSGFLPDTSCMIAAVCAWHERHGHAVEEIGRRLRGAEPMFLAGPSIVESYAVLTRLPPPHRMAPAMALELLEGSFLARGRVLALDARAYRALCRRLADAQIAGGRAYDAVIAECALREPDMVLLTLNAADFASFTGRGLVVVVPGE